VGLGGPEFFLLLSDTTLSAFHYSFGLSLFVSNQRISGINLEQKISTGPGWWSTGYWMMKYWLPDGKVLASGWVNSGWIMLREKLGAVLEIN
jgi:hypothetical protein